MHVLVLLPRKWKWQQLLACSCGEGTQSLEQCLAQTSAFAITQHCWAAIILSCMWSIQPNQLVKSRKKYWFLVLLSQRIVLLHSRPSQVAHKKPPLEETLPCSLLEIEATSMKVFFWSVSSLSCSYLSEYFQIACAVWLGPGLMCSFCRATHRAKMWQKFHVLDCLFSSHGICVFIHKQLEGNWKQCLHNRMVCVTFFFEPPTPKLWHRDLLIIMKSQP